MSLKQTAVRSAIWIGIQGLIRQGVNSIAFFALAVLLSPEQFGLGSIAVAIGMLARLVLDRGLRDGTIQIGDMTPEYLDTARQLGALSGALLACVVVAAGLFAALVLHEPTLGWLVVASGALPLFGGLTPAAVGYLERGFRQRELGFIQAASSAFGAVVALLMAWRGVGAGSVLALNIGEAAAFAVATNVLVGPISRLGLSIAMARRQIAFVWPIAVSGILYSAFPRLALLTVGAAFGSALAAQFRVGLQVYLLLVQITSAPVARALLPVLSRHSGDITVAYSKVSAAYAGFCTPFFFGVAAVAPAVIHLILGAKWAVAGGLAALLCFAVVGNFACQPLEAAMLVRGDSKGALVLALWDNAIGLAVIGIGAAFNVYAVAIGMIVQGVLCLLLAAVFGKRRFDVSAWRSVEPVVFYSMVGLATFAVARLTLSASMPAGAVSALVLAALGGASVYLILVRFAVRRLAPSIYWSAASLAPARLRRFV